MSPKRASNAEAQERFARLFKFRNEFGGNWNGADTRGVGRIAARPDARLETFDRKLTAIQQPMRDVEAGTAKFPHLCFYHDVVAILRRHDEAGTGVDHRIANDAVMFEKQIFAHAQRPLEERGRAGVE